MKPATYSDAVARYRSGDYAMSVPPVYTALWREQDWIAHIWGPYPKAEVEAFYRDPS